MTEEASAPSLPSPTTTVQETDPLLGSGVPAAVEVEQEPEQEEHLRDWEGHPWHRTPSIFWLLPSFCLFATAFGSVAVPRLNIILDLMCRQYFSERNAIGGTPQVVLPVIGGDDNEQCQIPEVHARTSTFVLVLGIVSGIISAFTAPRLGSLSDRYGRRLLMALSSFGLFAEEFTLILAVRFPQYFSINILLVGSVIDGLCGSFMLGMALAYSYAADCTSLRHRAMAFGAFQGCLFLGIAAGPALGGLLVEATGNIINVFYVALVAFLLFIAYAAFVLPESLSARRMAEARSKHAPDGKHWANPRNLLRPLGILWPTGPGTSMRLRLNLILLAAIDFTIFGVGMGGMMVIIMYAERQFHWRNIDSSVYLSIVNSTRVTVLFLILPPLITVFRWRRSGAPRQQQQQQQQQQERHKGNDKLDIALIRFAITVESLGHFIYALAPTGAVFTLAGALTALGSVGSPIIQSSLTKHVPSDRTGQLLGAIALLHSIARVVSPTVFNLVYASTVGSVPQTVFICLGSAFAGAFVCSWFVRSGLWWDEVTEEAGPGEGDAVVDETEAEAERESLLV